MVHRLEDTARGGTHEPVGGVTGNYLDIGDAASGDGGADVSPLQT